MSEPKPQKLKTVTLTQTRDYPLLLTLHRYDGALSVDQVYRWFFAVEGPKPETRMKVCWKRIAELVEAGYLARPKAEERRRTPAPIVLLGRTGAITIAAKEYGINPENTAAITDFLKHSWRSTPKWSRLAHDIGLNDIRHTFETTTHPTLSLELSYGQDMLKNLIGLHKTEYLTRDGKRDKKYVWPDNFYSLLTTHTGKRQRTRFFLEFDNASEPNVRFGRDKVLPGIQFVHSKQYKDFFHTDIPARYFVVVNGPEKRYHNLRQEVTAFGGAEYFFFAPAPTIQPGTVFSAPIWQCAHTDRLFSLSEYVTEEFHTFLLSSTKQQPKPKFV